MKRENIEFFDLKKKKHPLFGWGYNYLFQKRDWVKDETALIYTFASIERWAKNMQKLLRQNTRRNRDG